MGSGCGAACAASPRISLPARRREPARNGSAASALHRCLQLTSVQFGFHGAGLIVPLWTYNYVDCRVLAAPAPLPAGGRRSALGGAGAEAAGGERSGGGAGRRQGQGGRRGAAAPSTALHLLHLQRQGVRLLLPPRHHLDQHPREDCAIWAL